MSNSRFNINFLAKLILIYKSKDNLIWVTSKRRQDRWTKLDGHRLPILFAREIKKWDSIYPTRIILWQVRRILPVRKKIISKWEMKRKKARNSPTNPTGGRPTQTQTRIWRLSRKTGERGSFNSHTDFGQRSEMRQKVFQIVVFVSLGVRQDNYWVILHVNNILDILNRSNDICT